MFTRKVAAYRRLTESGASALLVLDEFAALGDPKQVQDLLRQAREARISVVVSAQVLPQDPALCRAVLQSGCVIAHRLETEDAQRVAATFGTRKVNEVTRQIGGDPELPSSGSLKREDEYDVHPDVLRRFGPGGCAMLTFLPEFRLVEKMKVLGLEHVS